MEFDEQGYFINATVRTKDGEEIRVRPARPEDRDGLEKMFRACSSETLYTRFLSPGLGVPLRFMDRLIAHDPPQTSTLLGIAGSGGNEKVVALLNFIETVPGESAEVAIVIQDLYQNRGLGGQLSRCIAEQATKRGVKRITADIDAGNRRVFRLIKGSGLPNDIDIDQGIAHVEIGVNG